jgi:serine/threonine protein kinase
MLHMQNKGFMHRALIPENILITSKSQGEEIRLTDFGNSGFG